MGKNVIVLVVAVALIVAALFGGYAMGIHRATTADGWLDEDPAGVLCFLLEVDGNLYVWDVSEEEWGDR